VVDHIYHRAPPSSPIVGMGEEHRQQQGPPAAWRLNVSDFQIPERPNKKEPPFSAAAAAVFHRGQGKQRKIAKYYEKQESLLKDFSEMESMNELGGLTGAPTEEELENLAKGESLAINLSNIINLILFAGKVVLRSKPCDGGDRLDAGLVA